MYIFTKDVSGCSVKVFNSSYDGDVSKDFIPGSKNSECVSRFYKERNIKYVYY